MKKAAQSERDARKRAVRVIADPSDLSLVSLVTQICSFSAAGTTERESETGRKRVHLEGQGLRQTVELRGANIRHLQWNSAAGVLHFFF